MKKDIIIYGAGGFGREVAWLIEQINQVKPEWNLIGYLDDEQSIRDKIINGYPVLGDYIWLLKYRKEIFTICAIADPFLKKKIIDRIKSIKNVHFATLIHPYTQMSSYVKIGKGTIICAGNIITTNIIIGEHVILNLSCTVGHDVIIKNFCTLHPAVNISGNVVIEKCTLVGTGCKIINDLKIGRNTIIGAGAVVTHDLPENCTAVGVPARPIKVNNSNKNLL
jgi:sugar O-acyltransferase (sialic acid O-acetyltransferase NeuD family)